MAQCVVGVVIVVEEGGGGKLENVLKDVAIAGENTISETSVVVRVLVT